MNYVNVPNRLPEPPPSITNDFHLDLLDGERAVGWITPRSIAFIGFANETEASHAAWMAFRTLSRRLSMRDGRRPIPVDSEPLRLLRDDDGHVVMASGRSVARLIEPGAGVDENPHPYGFELSLDTPLDEVAVRGKAHMIYRGLRRSGIRWAMWAQSPADRLAPTPAPTVPGNDAGMVVEHPLPWRQLGVSALLLLFAVLAVMVPSSLGVLLAMAAFGGLIVLRLTMFRGPVARGRALRVEGGPAPDTLVARYLSQR